MTELYLDNTDFTGLLATLAEGFKIKGEKNFITVPTHAGKGYYKSATLPSGITVLISDTLLSHEVQIIRGALTEDHFMLQFNEEFEDMDAAKNKRNVEDYHSVIKLSYTHVAETFVFPSTKRLRSVKFFFNKSQLYSLLSKEAVELLLNHHFPTVIRGNIQVPIATEYRVMLDELWTEKTTQPLMQNYIQNRVLLLLEKYICKLCEQKDMKGKKAKRNDDEALRLMRVESMLVKDFAVIPPKINELSRISAMSPTKLKNDFKQFYGFPIYVYFQKNRMLKAKSLLVSGKYNIREVGQKVGYTNFSHFAGAFKKEFGYLPSSITDKDGMLGYGG